jgi:hypothetical protein
VCRKFAHDRISFSLKGTDMPVRRYRLSRSEQDEQFEAAQVLRAQGVKIDIPKEWGKRSRSFEICISPDSTIYVHRLGMTLYAIYIRCVSLQNNLGLEHFEITPAWDDDIIPWSTDEKIYRFSRSLEFNHTDVLNHKFEARLRFHHAGDRIEGWLLAQGIRPVPTEYGPRHPAPFELSLWDYLGRVHSARAVAAVHRSAKIRELHIRQNSLFDREDSSSSGTYARYQAGLVRDLPESQFSVGANVTGARRTSYREALARPEK